MNKTYTVRRFAPEDAAEVLNIVHRGLREVNAEAYPAERIEDICSHFTIESILERSRNEHMYVAVSDSGQVVGTGSISPNWGSETESIVLLLSVLPDLIGQGIGSAIARALEQDEYSLRANRIEIPAAITALGFYQKMGYDFKNGITTPGADGMVRLEKRR